MAKVLEESKQLVTQHNHLIESSYKMTLNEKRLLMLGLSKVNPMTMPARDEPITFTVTAMEYCSVYNLDIKNTYRELQAAAKLLRQRYVKFHDKIGVIEDVNWIDSIKYYSRQGKVQVRLSWGIQLRLQGIFQQFTNVDLTKIQQLNSFYSIRLYELLKQFDSTGFRTISLEDLRFAMGVEKGAYKTVSELKRNVLKPALKELAVKSDLEITYKDKREGRLIVGFEFYFSIKKQVDLF